VHYFLDSSALIKRYITEQWTVWVRSITLPSAGHTIILAQVTQVEIVSGVFRRRREGLIPPRTAQAIRLLLHRHGKREYMVIELSAPIIQDAEDLLDKHPLRAYDMEVKNSHWCSLPERFAVACTKSWLSACAGAYACPVA
jgi:predicted nucleic acid-binding protein